MIKTSMKWHELIASAGFVGGMALLPFSTPSSPQSQVVSFGLPLLGMLTVIHIVMWCRSPTALREYLPAIAGGFALLFSQTLATIYSPTPLPSAARWVCNFIGFFVFLYLLSPHLFRMSADRSGSRHVIAIRVLVTSAAVMSAYFVITFLLAVREWGFATVIVQRYVGGVMALPWGASNVVASALLFPLFMGLYLARPNTEGGDSRLLRRGAVFVIFIAIAMTLSRGAILATACGLVTLGFLMDFRSRARLVVTIALIIGALLAVDYGIVSPRLPSGGLVQAFLERVQDPDVATLNLRTIEWNEYLESIAKTPFLGSGYYSSLGLHDATSHNLIITTVAERGVIGLLLSAAIVMYAAAQVGKSLLTRELVRRNPVMVYIAAGGVASLVHLMVEDANFTQQYIVYSWVYLAVVFLARQELQRDSSPRPLHSETREPGARLTSS